VNVLVIGAGVIGTVYGAHLGAAGHTISVLAHGTRTDDVGHAALRAGNVLRGVETHAPARVTDAHANEVFDLVLVALRRDHLDRITRELRMLPGQPLVLFFGNNSKGSGRAANRAYGARADGIPGRRWHDEQWCRRVRADRATANRA
jgi:ketopantoate reductase